MHQQVAAGGMMQHGIAFLGVGGEHERPVLVFDFHREGVLRFAVNHLESRDPHAAVVVSVIDRAVLTEFRAFNHVPAGWQGIKPGFDIPFVDTAEMLDDLLGAGWPPDLQRGGAPVGPAADPEMIEPADMVNVMMSRKNLVDRGEGDFKRREILWCTRSAIEQKFFNAGFNED